MSHKKIIETLSENGLSWYDVDTIHVDEATYNDFHKNADHDLRTSSHFTEDAPAMRVTEGEEKIVYVDRQGREHQIEL